MVRSCLFYQRDAPFLRFLPATFDLHATAARHFYSGLVLAAYATREQLKDRYQLQTHGKVDKMQASDSRAPVILHPQNMGYGPLPNGWAPIGDPYVQAPDCY